MNEKNHEKTIKKPLVLIVLILVLFVLAFLCNEIFGWMRNSEKVAVEIPEGAGAYKISQILAENKVIGIPQLFYIMQRSDAKSFKAGEHNFEGKGYGEVSSELVKNPLVNAIRVAIPEGFELKQIAARLEEKGLGFTAESFIKEADNGHFDATKYPFLQYITRSKNRLEGYLFPATYDFPQGISAHEVIEKMMDKFNKEFANADYERAKELGMTPDEIITLASIIEREAVGDSDRDKVASVFHNRLKSNSTNKFLQSCATVQYILGERKPVLSIADTQIDSPYNTYRNAGLPVGPIASPGRLSIQSALHPAETDYLFFVYTGGEHVFSKTYEEHLKAKK